MDGGAVTVASIAPLETLHRKCGVPDETILGNIRSAIRRGLPTFRAAPAHNVPVLVCAGGPSIRDYLGEIAEKQAAGAEVWAVNGAYDMLGRHGVVADKCALLDVDPRVADLCRHPAARHDMACRFAMCAGDVRRPFRADRHPVAWRERRSWRKSHADVCREEGHKCLLLGGGTTVALRCIHLAVVSGCQAMCFYGMDSSFAERTHAYDWFMEAPPETVLFRGRLYRTTLGLLEQAQRFMDAVETFPHVRFDVRGDGYLPDLWRDRTGRVAA
jgi:hypothetical protein